MAVLARGIGGSGDEVVTGRTFVESTAPAPAPPTEVMDADPMLVATVSSGVPVWPALMIAQNAPINFARVQFREQSSGY